MSISVSASASTVEEIKKQQEEAKKDLEDTKKQLEDANDEIDNLEDIKKGITDEIQQIDDSLVEVMTSVSILEEEIETIKAEIEDKKLELKEAERVMNEQYEAMKARIKFMYEKGDYTYMQLLWESESMGDVINKADYIEKDADAQKKKVMQEIDKLEKEQQSCRKEYQVMLRDIITAMDKRLDESEGLSAKKSPASTNATKAVGGSTSKNAPVKSQSSH